MFSFRQRQFIRCWLFFSAFIPSALSQNTAALSGIVTAQDDGKPIAAAIVQAVRSTPIPAVAFNTVSAANGSFSFSKMPAGTYRLCVQAQGTAFLNPCDWDLGRNSLKSPIAPSGTTAANEVIIAAAQQRANFALKVKRGTVVQINLNDSGQLAAASASPSAPGVGKGAPHVMLGVIVPGGLIRPLTQVSKSAASSVHQAVIPFDTPVKLSVYSGQLQLAHEDGKPIAEKGDAIDISRKTGSPVPKPVVVNITGRKP